jgi:hypothetical protein
VHGRRRCDRTLAPSPPSLAAFTRAPAPGPARPAGATTATIATIAAARGTATGTFASGALAPPGALAILTIFSIVIVASTASLGRTWCEDDGDIRGAAGRPDHLNAAFDLLGRANRLDRREGEDLDPLKANLNIGPKHGAGRLTVRDQRPVEHPFGLSSPGGAPGP